jgi:hypothetical protein
MSFQELSQLTIQSNYEVRRTGLNRLSIIIEATNEAARNPRLILNGDDAVLVHDEANSIVLPEFPQQYVPELLQNHTVLIGEKEPQPFSGSFGLGVYAMSRSPVRRFYEAIVCVSREGIAARQAHAYTAAAIDSAATVRGAA